MKSDKFSKPVDVLREAMMNTCLRDYRNEPGEVIRKLSKEQREKLKDLSSDDVEKMRFP